MATNFQIQKNRTSETLLELVNRNIGILHDRHMKDSVGENMIGNINDRYDRHIGQTISDDEAVSMAQKVYKAGGWTAMLGFTSDLKQKNENLLIDIYRNSSFSNATTKPGGQDPRTNKYDPRISAEHTYDRMFRDINGFPGDAPSDADIEEHARVGYNLGQQLGRQFGKPFANADSIWENVNTLVRDIASGQSNLADFLTFIEDPINSQRFEGHFSPSFNRPQIPELEKISLESLLNQNLLLPTGATGVGLGNISTGVNVFKDSYLKNRGEKNMMTGETDPKFPEGIIGGVPVHDLQEPQDPRGNKKALTSNKLFKFEDDARRLNSDRQDRGFTHNIDASVPGLDSAVINADPSKLGNLDAEARDFGNRQYFPFLFETENKKDVKQYAFFQATLTQLQESYAPSWTSKTSIGRTEKIHTYTDTDRVLDLSFAIFADSGRQLQNVRERVTWLAQQTYGESEITPLTNAITRIKSGPLLRLSLGDIFKRVPGYLRNLSFNWDFLGPGGKWEMTNGIRMPQGVQVQCSFQVIHQALPDRDYDLYEGLEAGMPPTGDRALIPLEGNLATEGDEKIGLQESYLQRLHLKNV